MLSFKRSDNHLSFLGISILIHVLCISFLGCVAIYSSSGGMSFIFYKQSLFLIFSIFLLWIISKINIKYIYHLTPILYLIGIIILFASLIFGYTAMGAKRWIRFHYFNIQPSEFFKIIYILYISHILHNIRFIEISKIKSVAIIVFQIIIPIIIILLQPNLGTAMILISIAGAMLFVGGVRKWKFISVICLTLFLIPIIWNYGLHDYQKKRINTFINPEQDLLGAGYNVMQSKIAIGSGALHGKGFMKGSQSQLKFLPEQHTDFIIAILAEEFGYIGICILLLLYLSLTIHIYIIAFLSSQHYYAMVSFGVATMLFLHLFINMSMISGIMPVVGIPISFVSYGGSNLLASFINIGIIINIIKYNDINDYTIN